MYYRLKYLCRIIIPREIKYQVTVKKENRERTSKLVISFCPSLVNEKHIKKTGAYQ